MYEDESYMDRVDWEYPEEYFDLFVLIKPKRVWYLGKEIKITKELLSVLFDFVEIRESNEHKYITIQEYSQKKGKSISASQKLIETLNKNARTVTNNKKIIGNRRGFGYFLSVSPDEMGVLIK